MSKRPVSAGAVNKNTTPVFKKWYFEMDTVEKDYNVGEILKENRLVGSENKLRQILDMNSFTKKNINKNYILNLITIKEQRQKLNSKFDKKKDEEQIDLPVITTNLLKENEKQLKIQQINQEPPKIKEEVFKGQPSSLMNKDIVDEPNEKSFVIMSQTQKQQDHPIPNTSPQFKTNQNLQKGLQQNEQKPRKQIDTPTSKVVLPSQIQALPQDQDFINQPKKFLKIDMPNEPEVDNSQEEDIIIEPQEELIETPFPEEIIQKQEEEEIIQIIEEKEEEKKEIVQEIIQVIEKPNNPIIEDTPEVKTQEEAERSPLSVKSSHEDISPRKVIFDEKSVKIEKQLSELIPQIKRERRKRILSHQEQRRETYASIEYKKHPQEKFHHHNNWWHNEDCWFSYCTMHNWKQREVERQKHIYQLDLSFHEPKIISQSTNVSNRLFGHKRFSAQRPKSGKIQSQTPNLNYSTTDGSPTHMRSSTNGGMSLVNQKNSFTNISYICSKCNINQNSNCNHQQNPNNISNILNISQRTQYSHSARSKKQALQQQQLYFEQPERAQGYLNNIVIEEQNEGFQNHILNNSTDLHNRMILTSQQNQLDMRKQASLQNHINRNYNRVKKSKLRDKMKSLSLYQR